MIYSRIAGTGSYLPPRVMTNAEFARAPRHQRRVDPRAHRHRAAPHRRQVAGLERPRARGEPARAAGRRRRRRGDRPDHGGDLDARLHLPQHRVPAAGEARRRRAARRSTCRRCAAASSTALATADSFIKSRMAKKALVVGAEVFSRILDWNDRGTCVLFGDGAGAVVLVAAEKPGIHASVLHADGSQAGMLSVPGNVCGGAIIGSPFLQMNGQAVFKFAVKVLDEVGARDRRRRRHEALGHRLADSAPGQRAHPRGHRAQARAAAREAGGHGRPSRQHFRRLGAARARRVRARRARSARATACCCRASAAASPGARRVVTL